MANLETIETQLQTKQTEYDDINNQMISLNQELEIAEEDQQEAFNKFTSEGGKISSERNQLEIQKQQKKDGGRTSASGNV